MLTPIEPARSRRAILWAVLTLRVHTLAARLDDATEANRELTVAIDEWRREMVSKGLREDQDRSDLIAAIDRMTKAFRESR